MLHLLHSLGSPVAELHLSSLVLPSLFQTRQALRPAAPLTQLQRPAMTQIHTKHHVEAHEHLNLPTFDLLLEPLVCVTSEGRQLTPGFEVICSTMHLLNPHYPSRRLMPSPQGFTAPETAVRHFCFAPGSQSYMFLPIPTRPSGVNAPPTVERWPSLLQPLLQLGPVYT